MAFHVKGIHVCVQGRKVSLNPFFLSSCPVAPSVHAVLPTIGHLSQPDVIAQSGTL
jgi:hypothetical protein